MTAIPSCPPYDWIEIPDCPVCAGASRRQLFRIEPYSIYECTACRLRYSSPCLSDESMKSLYASTASLLASHSFHEPYGHYGDLQTPSKTLREFHRGLDLLERALPLPNRRLLDIGCGNGFFLAAAQKRGWEVHGIDSSRANVQTAHEKFGLTLTCSSLESYAPDAPFDAIALWDVLEHFRDPHQALEKVTRLLKPGGVLLVAVPHDRNLIARIGGFLYTFTGGRLHKGVRSWYIQEHICYYTLNPLTRLFSGFDRIDYFYSSTDLKKYKFSWSDRLIASVLLKLGGGLGMQNRLIAVFRMKAPGISRGEE